MINDVIDATLDTTTVHSKIRDASLSEILRNGNTIKDTVSSTKFMIVDNDIKNDVNKDAIISELEKLQAFIQQAKFVPRTIATA